MSLVSRLLQAMVAAEGDVVVIHTGDLPYVAVGRAEVAIGTEYLTFGDVDAVLEQLLPAASLQSFNRLGAIRYECPPLTDYPDQRFTVVAYREADELWVEVRRDGGSARELPVGLASTVGFADNFDFTETNDPVEEESGTGLEVRGPASGAAIAPADDSDNSLALPAFDALWPNQAREQPAPGGAPASDGSMWTDLEAFELDKLDRGLHSPASPALSQASPPGHEHPVVTQTPIPPPVEREPIVRAVPTRPAVVLPMARPARNAALEPLPDLATGGLVRLLRTVAARGGSALYIASDAQPLMRIDGEMQPMAEVDPLSAADIETLLLGVMPDRTHEALRTGERTEWISEVPDLGRVRCVSFWDHRGAGGIFRIMTARVVTAEQLGLTREVQALALQPGGLVLIAGPRSSGKSTLISAFVDLINRTRRDHIITIENEIQVVHESRGSMVSQREVRGEGPELLAAIGVALREDPDVLAIEELRGDGIMPLVLQAARSGRLVIGGLPAHSAADAVDRVFDRFEPGQQLPAQLALAASLRGIVVQMLLRKPGGGRAAAREVLLNTPAVARVIADGRTSQLALAIEAGRNVGMMSLNESMVALVKSGAVDASEAYRRTGDRQGLLALLKRHGVDTSLIERLA
jgi:twitching motility protein PilT